MTSAEQAPSRSHRDAPHQLGIIGGGNMGAAIIRGAIAAGVLGPQQIIIAEIDDAKRLAMAELGCAVTQHAMEAAKAEQVLLAVKPQAFAGVASVIGALPESTIVLSIMAGLNSGKIRAALGGKARIVRAMPNTPCQIGAGMTAIALGKGAQPGDEALARQIFEAIGKTVMLDESHMYAVTAVSASGPAYIFALAEAMEAAAVRLGIDPNTARLLVEQTVMGSGRLLSESDQDAAALRAAVTSPAGTTAAAIGVFERRGFRETVIEALTAARDRGVELDRA